MEFFGIKFIELRLISSAIIIHTCKSIKREMLMRYACLYVVSYNSWLRTFLIEQLCMYITIQVYYFFEWYKNINEIYI